MAVTPAASLARPGRRRLPASVAVLGALGVALIAGAGALAIAAATRPPATSVEIHVRFSRFSPDRLEIPAGVPLTVVLVNDDPIDHEWIVGDPALHARHRTGTETAHDGRPSEVSIPALSSRTTVMTFGAPGELTFICHLPGHEAYGMVGRLTVTPAA